MIQQYTPTYPSPRVYVDSKDLRDTVLKCQSQGLNAGKKASSSYEGIPQTERSSRGI